jgi:hypothetical protein
MPFAMQAAARPSRQQQLTALSSPLAWPPVFTGTALLHAALAALLLCVVAA